MKKLIFILFFLTALIVLIVFSFGLNQVMGTVMEPGLKNKQLLVSKRWLFSKPKPQRGDIVLYLPQEQEIEFIGRVVALPGETVRIENGNLYLGTDENQYRLEEEYLAPGSKTRAYQENQWFKLGPVEYFIIGDKRDNQINIESSLISRQNIKAKFLFKL